MRIAALPLLIVALAPFLSVPANAELISGKQNCEVALDADKVTDNQKDGRLTASGNAVVTQCDMKMRADSIAYDRKNQNVIATGHIVVVSQKSGIVTGDHGVYDVPKKLVTLTGNVVLKQDKNVLRGSHGTYNLATGIAQVDSPSSAPGSPDGRVHVLLTQPASKGN